MRKGPFAGNQVGVGLLWAALLSGCATQVPVADEEVVRPRAQAWLDALMAYDIEGAYAFTPPAYQSAHSYQAYSKHYAGRGMWTGAELDTILCDDGTEFGRCKVVYLVTYRGFNMTREQTRQLTEVWVKIEGEWYTSISR